MTQKLDLKTKYETEVAPALAKEFAIKNHLAVPKIAKVVVNIGAGEVAKEKQAFAKLQEDLAKITGQKPAVRLARISVAGFGIRAGMPVGLSVTLRGAKMYAFLGRLIAVVLPRLRDFRGVPLKSFDQKGNYTLGFAEHTVFPEINLEKIDKPRGLEVTIVVKAGSKEKSQKLLELLGMPFAKQE